MSPSHPFITEIGKQVDLAEREVARALADQDELGVALARGRLADLQEIVERHTDHPVFS